MPRPRPARGPGAGRALLLLLLLVQAFLLFNGAWRVGPTYDEHFYAAAGVAYVAEGDLALNREHPPLLKFAAGLPLWLAGVRLAPHALESRNFPVAFFYQRNARDLDRNLFLARLPFCALTLLTTVLVYAAARRVPGWAVSGRAAAGAAALFALNPSVLAHGRLVSLDAGVTPLFFAAALAFLAALAQPSSKRRLAAAVLFGLANLAKFTALVLGPAFLGLALLAAWRQRSWRPLATALLCLFGGLGVFAAGYGFDARSMNSAWGSEHFVRDVPPKPVASADLARALAEAGAAAGDVERVAALAEPSAAVELLLSGLQDPGRAPAAAAALSALEDGPGALRKRAFERLLSLPEERIAVEQRDRLLALLSGRGAPDLAGWREFLASARGASWDRTVLYHGWLERLTVGLFGYAREIPLLTALKGIDQTLAHGAIGHGSYFRGRTLLPGRDFQAGNPCPDYYAVVLAIKNPLAWLALVALGLVLLLRPRALCELGLVRACALIGVPVGLFLVFSMGKALLGVRYLLPLFPFFALFGAAAFARLPRVSLVLLGVALLESLGIHPHELLFYNAAAGGPERGPAISVVGDDWGQDARAVGRFYARYREEIDAAGGLVYRPYSMADPRAFGLEAARPPTGPVRGILAVHAVDYYREAEEFRWLRSFEPFLVIGHAVYVYDTRTGAPGADPLAAWESAR